MVTGEDYILEMLSIWEGVSREERDKGKDRGRNKEKEQEAKCQLENSVQMSVPFAESLILCQRECCYSSPLVNTLPWLLLSGTWRHCLSSFHQQKRLFLVYHVISHLFRIWLPFFFAPIISALYIALMCISAHSSHSCFYLSMFSSLLSKQNIWWYQMSHIGKSDTHYYYSSPHAFIFYIPTTLPIYILKHL